MKLYSDWLSYTPNSFYLEGPEGLLAYVIKIGHDNEWVWEAYIPRGEDLFNHQEGEAISSIEGMQLAEKCLQKYGYTKVPEHLRAMI